MFTILLVIFLLLLILFLIKDAIKPKGYPPGPRWFPIVGCFPQFQRLYNSLGYYHLVWQSLSNKYGPIVGLRLGKDQIVVVNGLDKIKHVLTREDCDGRPDGFFFRMRAFEKRLGVVFTDGEAWQEQRRFTTRHLRSLGLAKQSMENIILRETEDLVESIKHRCQQTGAELSLNNACDVSVLNALWHVVAGTRFQLSDSRLLEILRLQHESFRQLDMSGGIVNQMPFLRFVAPEKSGYKTLIDTVRANQAFLRESITEHRQSITFGKTRDFIDAYLNEIELRKEEKNSDFHEEQLMTLCLDLFMAGSETTATSLGFLLLLMLHHPDVQTRIQDELDHVVGRQQLPSLAHRNSLPYVEAVIMEMQRLINVAPVAVPHRAIQQCTIFGHQVPKDTVLLMNLYSVHMDPEHWGDPEIFRPDRFLDETKSQVIKDEWFMPFGVGKRRCLGEALARSNLFLFFTALLQNFEFSVCKNKDEAPTLTPHDGITLSAKPFTGFVKPRPITP